MMQANQDSLSIDSLNKIFESTDKAWIELGLIILGIIILWIIIWRFFYKKTEEETVQDSSNINNQNNPISPFTTTTTNNLPPKKDNDNNHNYHEIGNTEFIEDTSKNETREVNFKEAFVQEYFLPIGLVKEKDYVDHNIIARINLNGEKGYLVDAILLESFRSQIFDKIVEGNKYKYNKVEKK